MLPTIFQTMFPTARDIKIVKPLQDIEVMEKESTEFACEVSHDEVEGQWFMNGTLVKVGGNIKIRQEGKCDFKSTEF